ncbi:hypothetical protein [Microbacterium sp. 77mftsu3.1]|uniref:hypothetical protein n=1 Tax=Microbacterium sp. 77mftsu3.1 TaxID=1761802 RepID=UPI000378D18B|nr:hypothetical protein [Microbacterium sp. 77mftsu3.1]SDH54249.1 hypothetical protein SAMN04488590_3525 [Microbacterium sp. 77mftsu3.1]
MPEGQSVLEVRFGQLAWQEPVHMITAVYEKFGWDHPMDGDYCTKTRYRRAKESDERSI